MLNAISSLATTCTVLGAIAGGAAPAAAQHGVLGAGGGQKFAGGSLSTNAGWGGFDAPAAQPSSPRLPRPQVPAPLPQQTYRPVPQFPWIPPSGKNGVNADGTVGVGHIHQLAPVPINQHHWHIAKHPAPQAAQHGPHAQWPVLLSGHLHNGAAAVGAAVQPTFRVGGQMGGHMQQGASAVGEALQPHDTVARKAKREFINLQEAQRFAAAVKAAHLVREAWVDDPGSAGAYDGIHRYWVLYKR